MGHGECVCMLRCQVVSDSLWLLPGLSVHGISQARVLEWVATPFSSRSSRPSDWSHIFCTAGEFFTIWATREALQTPVEKGDFWSLKLHYRDDCLRIKQTGWCVVLVCNYLHVSWNLQSKSGFLLPKTRCLYLNSLSLLEWAGYALNLLVVLDLPTPGFLCFSPQIKETRSQKRKKVLLHHSLSQRSQWPCLVFPELELDIWIYIYQYFLPSFLSFSFIGV